MSNPTPTPLPIEDADLVDALRSLGIHSVSLSEDGTLKDAERGYLLGCLLFAAERHASNLILRDELSAPPGQAPLALLHVVQGFVEMAARVHGQDNGKPGRIELSEGAGSTLWHTLSERADLTSALMLGADDTGGGRLADTGAYTAVLDATTAAAMLTRYAGAQRYQPTCSHGESIDGPPGTRLLAATAERIQDATGWIIDTMDGREYQPPAPSEQLSSLAAFLLASGPLADIQIDEQHGEVTYAFTVARTGTQRTYSEADFHTWASGFQDAVGWMHNDDCPHETSDAEGEQ